MMHKDKSIRSSTEFKTNLKGPTAAGGALKKLGQTKPNNYLYIIDVQQIQK